MSVPPGLVDTPGFQSAGKQHLRRPEGGGGADFLADFASLQGPYLVGTLLSCVLAGVVLVQAGE